MQLPAARSLAEAALTFCRAWASLVCWQRLELPPLQPVLHLHGLAEAAALQGADAGMRHQEYEQGQRQSRVRGCKRVAGGRRQQCQTAVRGVPDASNDCQTCAVPLPVLRKPTLLAFCLRALDILWGPLALHDAQKMRRGARERASDHQRAGKGADPRCQTQSPFGRSQQLCYDLRTLLIPVRKRKDRLPSAAGE